MVANWQAVGKTNCQCYPGGCSLGALVAVSASLAMASLVMEMAAWLTVAVKVYPAHTGCWWA